MSLDRTKVQLLLTEDLSPHKIAILILVNAYCTNHIPQLRLKPVLNCISQLITNESIYSGSDLVVIPSLYDVCHNVIHKAIVVDDDSQEAIKDSREIQKNILNTFWCINSVEDLDTCISSFTNIIVGPETIYESKASPIRQVSSRSILGSFIFKIITSFRLLKFDEVFLLFEALVDYRHPSRKLYLSLGGNFGLQASNNEPKDAKDVTDENKVPRSSDDALFLKLNQQLQDNLGTSILSSNKSTSLEPQLPARKPNKLIPIPKHDLQVLLDKQINLLEAYGTPMPKVLKEIMILMTSPNSNTCSIQNINFNNLPSYYYIKYLESLHDSNYNRAFEALHQYFDYMVSNNSKYFYHFALISRASLHQYFGEDDKAIDAIEEAISVARENKDNSTLTYILSWLFNFVKNKPELWKRQSFYNNNNESQLLKFLIQKSQSVSLSLHSMSFNFATLQIMNRGESMEGNSMSYFETILKATYISINDNRASFIKSTEMLSNIWCKVGVPSLCEVYNEISGIFTDKTTDKLEIQLRSNFLRYIKGETEIAHREIERLKEHSILKSNHSLFNTIQIRGLIISIKLNSNKGRYKVCEELIALLEDNDIKELELKNELLLLRIEVEIAIENYSIALSLISRYLAKESQDISLVIRLNLLKCKIFNLSGNLSKGLTIIIQQLDRATKMGFRSLVVEGLLILASTLNNLHQYDDCQELLEEVAPMIISVGNKQQVSEAHLELSRCYFGQYMQNKNSSKFGKCLRFLNLSIVGFNSSTNLVRLMKCFEFEREIATYKDDQSLLEHSQRGIDKLSIRCKEGV